MTSATEKSKLVGIWHIIEMSAWDADYINMEVQAYIRIGRNGLGEFQFGLVSGQTDGRFEIDASGPKYDFTWDGSDEGDDISGDGWLSARNDGTAEGEFRFHMGDSSLFQARKLGDDTINSL